MLGARYGHVGLAVRRDREKSRVWFCRAEPPAGLAHPGLSGRLGRTSGPGHLFLGQGVRLRGVPGSGLSILGRVKPGVDAVRVGPIVVLGGTGPFGGIGPGGTRPFGGIDHAGFRPFGRIGHAGFRVSIPGDFLAAAGGGAQVLGEWPRAPVVGGG
jgi:hypothetical protein